MGIVYENQFFTVSDNDGSIAIHRKAYREEGPVVLIKPYGLDICRIVPNSKTGIKIVSDEGSSTYVEVRKV